MSSSSSSSSITGTDIKIDLRYYGKNRLKDFGNRAIWSASGPKRGLKAKV
jgi:hypothetical protein